MSSITQICLTDPGEGLTEAEIIEIKVKEGDRVEINDPVVTVETAKSAVELPSHVAGIVAKVHVKEGDELNVGEPMFDIETDPEAGQASEPDASEKADASEKPEETEPKTLVGYGARETPSQEARDRAERCGTAGPDRSHPREAARA